MLRGVYYLMQDIGRRLASVLFNTRYLVPGRQGDYKYVQYLITLRTETPKPVLRGFFAVFVGISSIHPTPDAISVCEVTYHDELHCGEGHQERHIRSFCRSIRNRMEV